MTRKKKTPEPEGIDFCGRRYKIVFQPAAITGTVANAGIHDASTYTITIEDGQTIDQLGDTLCHEFEHAINDAFALSDEENEVRRRATGWWALLRALGLGEAFVRNVKKRAIILTGTKA